MTDYSTFPTWRLLILKRMHEFKLGHPANPEYTPRYEAALSNVETELTSRGITSVTMPDVNSLACLCWFERGQWTIHLEWDGYDMDGNQVRRSSYRSAATADKAAEEVLRQYQAYQERYASVYLKYAGQTPAPMTAIEAAALAAHIANEVQARGAR
ncbi:MAG: hypothetical protein OZ924_10575 [Burkholderiaceae bacterium]|nr:hypothetical protein [Burkholderiaceae bacterium]